MAVATLFQPCQRRGEVAVYICTCFNILKIPKLPTMQPLDPETMRLIFKKKIAYDFLGKPIIPFATSGGGSIKKACAGLKAAYPQLNWKEDKLLNASKTEPAAAR